MALVSTTCRMPAMKPVGERSAGNPHAAFDERGRETGHCYRARPRLYASDTRRRASAVRARLRDRLFHRGSTTVSGQALDVVGLVGAALGHPPHRSGPGGLKPARDAAEQFG